MFLGVYPDGTDVMTGKHSGVVSQKKEFMPDCMSTHSFHDNYLVMKNSLAGSNTVFCDVCSCVDSKLQVLLCVGVNG